MDIKTYSKEYHEVVLGEMNQKCRFDIDIPYETFTRAKPLRSLLIREETEEKWEEIESLMRLGNRLIGKLIDSVREVFLTYDIKIEPPVDISFHTSHSFESPIKYSAHLIFPNHCHFNYEEAKEFYRLVVENGGVTLKVAESYGALDGSIYASLKSFRMEGSTKGGKRPKTRTPLPYNGKIYKLPIINNPRDELSLFRQSCITDCCSTIRIPVIIPEKKVFISNVTLPPETEDKIAKHIGDDFVVEEIKGGLIVLKRLRPSFCALCNREHEADNPYLTVKKNGEVYFHCRRAVKERNKYKIFDLDGIKCEDEVTDRETVTLETLPRQKEEQNSIPHRPIKIKREGVNFNELSSLNYDIVKMDENLKKKKKENSGPILKISKFC
jgi:hypothetical protein